MDTLSYKTISINSQSVEKSWLLIDAENQVLGRLCSKVARLLRGKHKPYYTPHVDCGDNVIVINAEKIKLTGNKWKEKKYFRYSGYPGGQKTRTAIQQLAKDPTKIIEHAVKGMLPKNRLGRKLFKNLFVYESNAHKHQAQKPKTFNLESFN